MTAPRQAPALAVWLALAAPLAAQQVVGHVVALPPGAGLNATQPVKLLADPTRPLVFVLHQRGVTLLDRSATPSFVSFETGTSGRPADMALDAGDGRLYVSHGGGDASSRALLVVDVSIPAVLARVPLPFEPGDVAVDPGKQAVVVERGGGRIAAIGAGSLALQVATLAETATRVAVNPETGKIYVLTANGVLVLRSDLGGAGSVRFFGGTTLAVDPVGGKVYVGGNTGTLVLDAVTDAVLAIQGLPVTQFAVSPTTGWAYGTSSGSFLAAIAPDPSQAFFVPIGGTPPPSATTAIVLDDAAHLLYTYSQTTVGQSRVDILDVAGGLPAWIRSGPTGVFAAACLAWNPVSQRLYLATQARSEVREIPVTGAASSIRIGCDLIGGAANDPAGVAFALDTSGDRALAVSLSAGTLLAAAAVAVEPVLSTLDPGRNEVYVVSQGERAMSVLDATTGQFLRTAGPLPGEIPINVDLDHPVPGGGPTVYLLSGTDHVPGDIATFEPGRGDAIREFDACGSLPCTSYFPLVAALNPTAHRYYVETWAATLASFDTLTGAYLGELLLTDVFSLDQALIAVDPPSNQVFLAPDVFPHLIAVQDGATPGQTTIPLSAPPTALELGPGGLYVAERDAGRIEVIDTTTNRVVRTISTSAAQVRTLHVQAQNGWLWAGVEDADGSGQVEVYDASGLRARLSDLAYLGPLARLGPFWAAPVMNDRGFSRTASGRLAFADNRHGTIAVLDPSGAGDLQLTSVTLPDGVPGVPYPPAALTHTAATGPFRFEVASGALPPGLALDVATGKISGTPSRPGLWSFLVRLTDLASGQVDVEDLSMQVLDLVLLTRRLPAVGCSPYRVELHAIGGVPPYVWTATGLPAGFVLDPDGVLSGAPTRVLACPADGFSIEARDARGSVQAETVCIQAASLPPDLPIGNLLRAARSGGHADLSFAGQAPPPEGGINVYRSGDAGASWQRLPLASPKDLPSTRTGMFRDFDALNVAPPIAWYLARWVDGCGNEGP